METQSFFKYYRYFSVFAYPRGRANGECAHRISIIEKRIERGNFLINNLPESYIFPGTKSTVQTYWAFPVLTSEPSELIPALRKAGFDATQHSNGSTGNTTHMRHKWVLNFSFRD